MQYQIGLFAAQQKNASLIEKIKYVIKSRIVAKY